MLSFMAMLVAMPWRKMMRSLSMIFSRRRVAPSSLFGSSWSSRRFITAERVMMPSVTRSTPSMREVGGIFLLTYLKSEKIFLPVSRA